MSTSGSISFNQTASDLCKASLRKLGILGEGENMTAQQASDCLDGLNRLLKKWQADGLHLWKEDEVVVFPANSTQPFYTLSATGDYSTLTTELITTTLSVAAAVSASSITVTTATGITNGFYIGICLDDNTIHWTTVNGTPIGSVVMLTLPLVSAASINNTIYCFQTKANKPLRVLDARVQAGSNSEIQITQLAREEYFILPNKTTRGLPTQYYYDSRLDTGRLYVYPMAQGSSQLLKLTVEKFIEDCLVGANNLDLPAEWLYALVWNLAEEMALEFGTTGDRLQVIMQKSQKSYEDILGWDRENVSIVFQPSFY